MEESDREALRELISEYERNNDKERDADEWLERYWKEQKEEFNKLITETIIPILKDFGREFPKESFSTSVTAQISRDGVQQATFTLEKKKTDQHRLIVRFVPHDILPSVSVEILEEPAKRRRSDLIFSRKEFTSGLVKKIIFDAINEFLNG